MAEPEVRSAREADPEALDTFLRRSFGDAKADFLRDHGDWWHRESESPAQANRWVLLDGDSIAGYCGVIPTRCAVAGRLLDAVWWMDLVIAPEYRGRGLQTHFDDLVRSRGSLLLGFPNQLAAKIHRHHGWGVREDLRTLLLPLEPRRLRAVRRARGVRGAALRLAAAVLAPAAALWRRRLAGHGPGRARRLDAPDFGQLADVARRGLAARWVTTWRDAAYLSWRYADGPHRCIVYAAGEGERPDAALVARRIGSGRHAAERWLDIFGDLEDEALLSDLVRFAAGEAARAGIGQVTALTADGPLRSVLRRTGFVVGSTSRVCWLCEDHETVDHETMAAIASAPHHWCLGDSDNDQPESEEP